MKYLLILTFISQMSIGQTILKDANVLVVKGVSYMELCTALLDSGYSISKKDNDLQTVRTEPRQYPRYWNATYIINVRVKDSTAFISSTFTAADGGLFKNEEVSYIKKNLGAKHLVGVPFYLMDKFAKSFNKPIEYIKQ